jgi:hypothetical protein
VNCSFRGKKTRKWFYLLSNLHALKSEHSTQEVPKHAEDCISIVFTFLCMEGWFDKLNFCIMHGTYKLREKGIVIEQVLEIFVF